jgi:hypothetical protein
VKETKPLVELLLRKRINLSKCSIMMMKMTRTILNSLSIKWKMISKEKMMKLNSLMMVEELNNNIRRGNLRVKKLLQVLNSKER